MGNLTAWWNRTVPALKKEFSDDSTWRPLLTETRTHMGVHLAVLVEPYLSYILDCSKTIESRFATRRFAPYGKAQPGDLLLLKASAGPVVGLCVLGQTWFRDLTVHSLTSIKRRFGKAIRADSEDFWRVRESATYASLMEVREPRTLASPLLCPKKDRRGWVILQEGTRDGHFSAV